MVVSASSPDRNISARVSNYTEAKVTFQPGTFQRYDERQLSYQLARLGVLTWIAYQRARSAAYRNSRGISSAELAEAERPSNDPHRRRYEEELGKVEGEGSSVSGVLRIRTAGMMQWHVDIEPGTVRRLGEQQFLAELHSAFNALLNDREMKIILLKSEYFDLGLPRKWRDLTKRLTAATRSRR